MLADRLRETMTGTGAVEKRMFGGLAFLLDGHMAVCAVEGGLMVRCAPETTDTHTEAPGVERFEMRGRRLAGWLHVDAAVLDEETLEHWASVGATYAASLPPKAG